MTFLEFAPSLDADPRVMRAHLLLIAHAHDQHRPNSELTFLKMSYHEYLLRLPTALEKVLIYRRGGNVGRLHLKDFERDSVEAKILALRFEPWTSNYRLAMSALVASGLLSVLIGGDQRNWKVIATEKGRSLAQTLAANAAFEPTWRRAEIIV